MTHRLIPLCLALGLIGAAYPASPEKSSVAYPTGYRKWALVKSMVIYSDKHPLFAVMEKDRARFKATGGWGFEAFKGDSQTERTVTDASAQCFSCHQKQKDNDFVFSGYLP